MGAIREVRVPDIGDFKEVPVIEIMVKPGDTVKPEDSLIVLESDKATLDVPAPFGGAIRNLQVRVGDKVSKGSVILEIEASEIAGDAAPAALPVREPEPASTAGVATASRPPPPLPFEPATEVQPRVPHASPSIRRFARELGVNLGLVPGSGPLKRILKEDVQAFVREAIVRSGSTSPAVAGSEAMPALGGDLAQFGRIERVPLSETLRRAGANLHRSWISIPHVTHFDEADITELEPFRREVSESAADPGAEVTLLPFLLKAVVAALKRFPTVNASLDGDDLVLKRYYHIGFGVETPNGFAVPVIRDVDRKGILDLVRELGELSVRARDDDLKPTDLEGGTFTVASVAGIGGTGFTPIIQRLQVAILGVAQARPRLFERDGAVAARQMLPICLSYDHRVIDGAVAARFMAWLSAAIGDLRRATL